MGRSIIFFLCCFNLVGFSFAQNVEFIAELEHEIEESSGLIYIDDKLITHNDSNGSTNLYTYNLKTLKIDNANKVLGATNHDWEDITYDEEFIYIGDFGNNSGDRKDLKIYKISRDSFHKGEPLLTTGVIHFTYSEQIEFSSVPYGSNFDAEAIVIIKNSIYLFTKNWDDFKTSIYKIPKDPGNYQLKRIASLNIDGLVSAAAFNKERNEIALTAYNEDNAFILLLKDFEDNINKLKSIRIDLMLPKGISYQVEGVDYLDNTILILSSETGVFGKGGLFKYYLKN